MAVLPCGRKYSFVSDRYLQSEPNNNATRSPRPSLGGNEGCGFAMTELRMLKRTMVRVRVKTVISQ